MELPVSLLFCGRDQRRRLRTERVTPLADPDDPEDDLPPPSDTFALRERVERVAFLADRAGTRALMESVDAASRASRAAITSSREGTQSDLCHSDSER